MLAKHKQTIPKMKQFILKVSEWHALLFLTSLLLPPPLYFFLGQNYSENVFEFVNHFDSPSPLTFAGKSILCQKTVLPDPASSYNLLSCQGLSGSVWGLTALGTQHGWSKGRAGQEGKPQPLSRQWWALKKLWVPLSWDWTRSRDPTEATRQREFLIKLWLPDVRGALRVLVLLEDSKPGPWRLNGCTMGTWSCLLSRWQKF